MFKKGLLFLACIVPILTKAQQANIIPQPVSIKIQDGGFIIDKNTGLKIKASNKELQAAAVFFNSCINHISGISLPVNISKSKTVEFKIAPTAEIGDEGYLLNVSPSSIVITANSKKGIIYGMQSLFQMLPAIRTNAVLKVPAMQVKDYPCFRWRGMHLDVSRHFFSPELVKLYIDLMADYKMNTFHWHLVDDQGWRIEIKKYPKLTEIGAWRANESAFSWTARPQSKETKPATYGGYYTQQQIKDIIVYAAQRNITIVPEIEMPGHVASAIASYPYLSCTQKPQQPMTGGNYFNISSNYCAGNDSVFLFLENVLSEVINLFPSQYIHIGGDEVDKTPWKNCVKCQARIKAEGLHNEEELQSYFIKRIEKFIVSKKRKMIGWDEILEGGLAPEATVMSWRGETGGIAAAKMGHDVVMTPGAPLYFDHYQTDPATEPRAFGGFNTVKRVYDYDPVPAELSEQQAKHILGAQANLWTEQIATPQHVTYMILPRMLALAEVDWSPKELRNWNDFNGRMQTHLSRFDQQGLHHSKGNFKVEIKPNSENGQLFVTLFSEAYKGEIFYTTNGEPPTTKSTLYSGPIRIDSSVSIQAISVVNGNVMSVIPSRQNFVLHKAVGRNVSYTYPVSNSYMADGPNSLADGVRGTIIVGKYWHGISGKDLIATIDLGKAADIHSMSLGCLQSFSDWIMMPQWVKFELSEDGTNYKEVKTVSNTVMAGERAITIKDFTANFPVQTARYVRVTAKALDGLPQVHPAAGKPAWIFADEIVVK